MSNSKKCLPDSMIEDLLGKHNMMTRIAARAGCALLKIDYLNKRAGHCADLQGIEFAQGVLDALDIHTTLAGESQIPSEGPFVMVCNHPTGMLDGVALLANIGKIRPDVKFLANFMLSRIPNLSEYMLPLNPFTDRKDLRGSTDGLRKAFEHVAGGGALIIFPAGEVSSDTNPEKVVKDVDWKPNMAKFVKKCGVPVIPVHLECENSPMFHKLGHISPVFRTLRLGIELANKSGKTEHIQIGCPIGVAEIQAYDNMQELASYLWNRSYALDRTLIEPAMVPSAQLTEKMTPIRAHLSSELLKAEIDSCMDNKVFDKDTYSCYLVDYKDIPNLMQEIGVCREETFRAVGEGTGREIDLDDFDTYYKHLILWDNEDQMLVGAYRLGIGADILPARGREGMYTYQFFRYNADFDATLAQCIEAGRAFVRREYQKKPLPLFLLLQGVFQSVMDEDRCNYLIGPASISSSYPKIYQALIVRYLFNNWNASQFAPMMNPVNPYHTPEMKVDLDKLISRNGDSLEHFDRLLSRMSGGEYRVPTLIKKYLKMGTRVITTNVDKDFFDSLDIFIIQDKSEIDSSELVR